MRKPKIERVQYFAKVAAVSIKLRSFILKKQIHALFTVPHCHSLFLLQTQLFLLKSLGPIISKVREFSG